MFGWLKNFLEWPDGGIKNISELGKYVKERWLNLIIFVIVLVAVIWIFIMLIRLIRSLFK